MPSPVGHALAGFAAGWALSPMPPDPEPPGWFAGTRLHQVARWRWAWVFAGVGVAADLDLLVGLHRTYTHSVGAAALAFAIACAATRRRGRNAITLAAGVAASYLSHVLLDWLGADHSTPPGIMALWPFSSHLFISGVALFSATSRKLWMLRAWKYDTLALARELLLLGPFALAAWRLRRPPHAEAPDRTAQVLPSTEPARSQNQP